MIINLSIMEYVQQNSSCVLADGIPCCCSLLFCVRYVDRGAAW